MYYRYTVFFYPCDQTIVINGIMTTEQAYKKIRQDLKGSPNTTKKYY